ncbi:hypothetical protein UR09_02795 [Candidatus Nitromaritima sp. SCGC AAA799-A02]|nr:hypothetical protein UR09_02795 [Candidatus Nitromaritima sp. SCGC AAA799-A02]
MFREKLFLLIAENGSRIKKINIRYTKANDKHSAEHLDALYGSYERTIRDILKQFHRTEKSVRMKYQVPMGEARQKDVLKMITTEVELLVEKIKIEYRKIFENQHRGEEFDRRIRATLDTSKRKMEEDIQKLAASLNEKINAEKRIPPGELAKFYDLDESTLIDLKAIEPLQTIHQVFDRLAAEPQAKFAFDGIRESIILCSKLGTQVEIDPRRSHTVEARRLKRNSMVSGTLVLNELIYNIHIMAEQIQLPKDRRNEDIVKKTWARLKESLEGHDGSTQVLEHLIPFFQMFSLSEIHG